MEIIFLFLIIVTSLSAICAVIGARNNLEKHTCVSTHKNQGTVKNGKCVLMIDGKDFPAVFEEHVFKCFSFDENANKICEEIIKRKYYLFNPFPYFKELTFDVVQDKDFVYKCYMSDDRMCLIEC